MFQEWRAIGEIEKVIGISEKKEKGELAKGDRSIWRVNRHEASIAPERVFSSSSAPTSSYNPRRHA